MRGHNIKKVIEVNTSYGRQRVALERDARRGHIATAPDLPGVSTWGKNLTHVKQMIREAIELCIESMAEARIAAERASYPMSIRKQRERILA